MLCLAIAPILKLIKTEDVKRVVVGLPINMDGSEGPRAQATRAFARNLTKRWLVDVAAYTRSVKHEIDATYRYRPGLKRGLSLHLLAWIGNGGEAWVALHFMGVPLSLAAVLAIESLLYAIRSLAFLVPNAAGVQEGAYVMLGGLFGLPPDTALALSLLKRARDLAIGINQGVELTANYTVGNFVFYGNLAVAKQRAEAMIRATLKPSTSGRAWPCRVWKFSPRSAKNSAWASSPRPWTTKASITWSATPT